MQFDLSGEELDPASVTLHTDEDGVPPVPPDFKVEKKELEWVLCHPEISRSAALVRFLSFICGKYFDGESKGIREQTIAVEALGRKQSNFDPHADPIVRVTARTLRKRLQDIYRSDGRGHQVQIVLPLGHYVPHFIRPANMESEGAVTAEECSADPVQTESTDRHSFRQLLTFGVKQRTVWTIASVVLAVPAIFLVGVLVGRHENQPRHAAGESINWGDPVWSDEFDGAVQQLPDPSK